MKTTIRTLIGLSCAALIIQAYAADEPESKTITKTFAVEPGGEVSVDADQGDIEIVTGDQNKVDVVVEREVSDGSESQVTKALKGHKVTFSQDGKHVRIDARSPKVARSFFSARQPELHVHFKITVPRRFDASLNTAGGNIEVSDLNGAVDARTSGGDLNFAKVQGPVEGHTSGGNVHAAGCTDKLTIQTSGGNIVVKDFTGPTVQADTSGGNVDVVNCSGKLQTKTSGGNIRIEDFAGASAYADTSGGSISVSMNKEPEGDCWFSTSGGNITARLTEALALNLHAQTDGGSVSSAIPVTVQGKQQEGKLEGKINGGGPNLALKTSGGNIQVVKL